MKEKGLVRLKLREMEKAYNLELSCPLRKGEMQLRCLEPWVEVLNFS